MATTIKNSIKKAKESREALGIAIGDMQRHRREYLAAAAQSAVANWHADHGEKFTKLRTDAARLDSTLVRLHDTLADRVEALPYPRGTKLYQWTRRRWSSINAETTLSGTVGKLDVWRSDSNAPANQRWGQPNVGTPYIRLLRKDGSEGKRWEHLRVGTWCPEGINPNDNQGEK